MHDSCHPPVSPPPGEQVFVMTSERGKQTALSCPCYRYERRDAGGWVGRLLCLCLLDDLLQGETDVLNSLD